MFNEIKILLHTSAQAFTNKHRWNIRCASWHGLSNWQNIKLKTKRKENRNRKRERKFAPLRCWISQSNNHCFFLKTVIEKQKQVHIVNNSFHRLHRLRQDLEWNKLLYNFQFKMNKRLFMKSGVFPLYVIVVCPGSYSCCCQWTEFLLFSFFSHNSQFHTFWSFLKWV